VRRTLPPALALAAGVAAIAGSFIAWAEMSVGPVVRTASGVDGWEGKLAIVGGLAMIVPAVRAFRGGPGALLGLRGALVGGLLAAGPALYDVITLNDQFVSAAAEAGIPDSVARDALESGRLVIAVAPGLWLVVFAGVLGMVAALLAVLWAPPAATSGPGLRGWQASDSDTPPATSAGAASDPGVPSPWASSAPSSPPPSTPAPGPPPRPDAPAGP
jgi:hypothetical protein